MKKFFALALAAMMAASLAGCSSGVSQEEYDQLQSQYQQVLNKNSELEERNTELSDALEKANDLAAQNLDSRLESLLDSSKTFLLSSAASMLDQDATCQMITDEIALIAVPMNGNSVEDVINAISENSTSLALAIKSSDISSCILMIIGDDDNCLTGLTIYPDGNTDVFASESFE